MVEVRARLNFPLFFLMTLVEQLAAFVVRASYEQLSASISPMKESDQLLAAVQGITRAFKNVRRAAGLTPVSEV